MAKLTVEYDDKKLVKNVQSFDDRLRRNVRLVVARRAAISVAWMKQNAPWTDRTGAARSGLMAIPYSGKSFEEIVLAYSVYYGIWLEVAHDRQYSVILPAMRVMGEGLINDLQQLIDFMGNE